MLAQTTSIYGEFLFPRRAVGGLFEEEFEAGAQLILGGVPGVEALAVNAVAIADRRCMTDRRMGSKKGNDNQWYGLNTHLSLRTDG